MSKTLPAVAGVALALLLSSGAANAQGAAPRSGLEAGWSEGSRLVSQGVTALVAADKVLSDAARRGVDAMGRRTTAAANVVRASEEFRRLSSQTPASTDAAEAQRWAGVVQAAASRWLAFQTQERDAARDLAAAVQQNASAQKSIEAALAQVDRGRRMVAEPQQTGADPAPLSSPAPVGAAPGR